MNNSTITTSEDVPPQEYSPKVAFIIGGVFIAFMVSIIIMALARKAREVEEQTTQHQEGKEMEPSSKQHEHELWDAMARLCSQWPFIKTGVQTFLIDVRLYFTFLEVSFKLLTQYHKRSPQKASGVKLFLGQDAD